MTRGGEKGAARRVRQQGAMTSLRGHTGGGGIGSCGDLDDDIWQETACVYWNPNDSGKVSS